MKNYKLIIQYDGTNFHGWQTQKNAVTIQETITNAFEVLIKEKINLIGAGRTDTGVHALGQTANFRTEQELDLYRLQYAANCILPKEISIRSMTETDTEFHSRYDAKARTYWYLISEKKSPFLYRYSYYYPFIGELKKLQNFSERFLGDQDFTTFAKELPQTDHCNCIVQSVRWRRFQDIIIFSITANRFLHGMVRGITGTLLKALKEDKPAEWITEVIEARKRCDNIFSVPPAGLFLTKIRY